MGQQDIVTNSTFDGKLVKDDKAGQQVVLDSSNVPRVLMGNFSAGTTDGGVGFKVSKPGFDVRTASDANLIFNSAQNVFKIALTGTVSIVVAGGSDTSGTATVTHNLGYNPIIFGTVTLPAGLSSEIVQFPGAYWTYQPAVGGVGEFYRPRVVFEYFASNTNSTLFQIRNANLAGGTYVVRYYMLQETAN